MDDGKWFLYTTGMAFAYLAYLFAKQHLTKDRFLRFLGIVLIGLGSSLFPWGPLGLMCGFPSAILAAILVSCFLDGDK